MFTSKSKKRSEKILLQNKSLFKYKIYPSSKTRGKPNPDGLNKIITLSKLKKKRQSTLGTHSMIIKPQEKLKLIIYMLAGGTKKYCIKQLIRLIA